MSTHSRFLHCNVRARRLFHEESTEDRSDPTPGDGRRRDPPAGLRRGIFQAGVPLRHAGEFPRPRGGESRAVEADRGVPRRPARHDRDAERGRRSDPSDRHVHRLAGGDRRGERPRRPARRRRPEDQRRRAMDGPGPVLDRPRRPPGPRGPLRGRAALGAREGIGPGADLPRGQPPVPGDHGRTGLEGHRGRARSFRQVVRAAPEGPRDREHDARPRRRPGRRGPGGPAAGATPAARPRRPADRRGPGGPGPGTGPAAGPGPASRAESQPDPATGPDAAAGPGPRPRIGSCKRATTGRIS